MMNTIKDICKRTETQKGRLLVGASVLILGLTHFGKSMGLENMLGGWVGTVAGSVGVVVGVCVLMNVVMGDA